MLQLQAPHEHEPDWSELVTKRQHSLSVMAEALGCQPWDKPLLEPVPEWLLPGLLQKSSLHVLSSNTGCCKTWLALTYMLSGMYGIPALGVSPTRRFSTLYLAADSTSWDIGQQLRKLMVAHGLNHIPETESFFLPMGFLFDDPRSVLLAEQLIQDWDIDLFVVDVLLYSHSGNENDNAYMARHVLRQAKALRDKLGVAVLFLHHNAKPRPDMETSFRGAGTIVQAVEHHHTLVRMGADILLDCAKVRGEETLEPIRFSLAPGDHGGLHLKPTGPANTVSSRILATLRLVNLPMSTNNIIVETGLEAKRIYNALNYLRKANQVELTEKGWVLRA